MPLMIVLFQKSWKLSSFKESFRRSRATAGSTWSFFDDWAAVFNSSVNLSTRFRSIRGYTPNPIRTHRVYGNPRLLPAFLPQMQEGAMAVVILGGVVSVDDCWRAQQLLELLGFECVWETLQRHQQQLQLLWSPEGCSQVCLQSTEQHLLKHLLWYLTGRGK